MSGHTGWRRSEREEEGEVEPVEEEPPQSGAQLQETGELQKEIVICNRTHSSGKNTLLIYNE